MLRVEYLRLDLASHLPERVGPGLVGVLGFPAVPGDCRSDVPCACVQVSSGGEASSLCEVWTSADPVQRGADGAIRYAISGDLLFGVIAIGGEAQALRDLTRRIYGDIFAMLGRQGLAHVLRIWNYIARINEDEGGIERYRLFNIGRSEAFEAAGRSRPGTIPAACALGTDSGSALTVYFVASREAGRTVENPRQVSAYRYPPEHGERSPTFSRAVLYPANDPAMLFISGTASIVGHRTQHAGDVVAQVRETLANLEAVYAQANRLSRPGAFRMREASYKVYVRRAADAQAVRHELGRALGEEADVNVLRADICRSDLLVEVEAIAYAANGGRPGR